MSRVGLQNVKLIETPGNPVVYGDWTDAPGAPTLRFYGHYDVQPAILSTYGNPRPSRQP
jgi:acetylornithine deacetylase/succinyl-diaminopimelate desuccinylase-like protein